MKRIVNVTKGWKVSS